MNQSLLKKAYSNVKFRQFTFSRWFFSRKKQGPGSDNKTGKEPEAEEEMIELEYDEPKYACNEGMDIIEERFGPPRTWAELKHDLIHGLGDTKSELPKEFDVIVIGGGPIGCTFMNIVRKRFGAEAKVCIIDSDFSYKRFERDHLDHFLAPQLSVGHINQQFSLKENIKLAQFANNHIRELNADAKNLFGDDVKPISYRPFGHLTLATEKGAEVLKENHIIQGNYGVHTELSTAYQLGLRFPWLNVSDIALACVGQVNEGWFDPWEYLVTVRTLGMQRGAWYLEATPLEFHFKENAFFGEITRVGIPVGQYQPCYAVVVQDKKGQIKKIVSNYFIIALGSETGNFAKNFLFLDKHRKGLFGMEVPINRKKHYVFYFEAGEGGPGFSSPMIVDPTGIYVRRDGFENNYICGCSLPIHDPDWDNLSANENIFLEHIWPVLAHRIPAFEKIQLKSGWAYFEDHNYFDETPFVGLHPAYHNVYFACGFGKNSYMFAPGIGNALNEYLYNSYYTSIDLTRFNYNRIAQEVPLLENVIC